MAIRLIPEETPSRLFCCSKWWGNPDMPPKMGYPMIDGYPLTFLCQIDCEDIASFDKDGLLPHTGMLYFFAAIDEYLGYEVPHEHSGFGKWPKNAVAVKYVPEINMETFDSFIMVDDEDNELSEPALRLRFEECADNADGLKLLGLPFFEDVRQQNGDCISLLQLDGDEALGLCFSDSGTLNILIRKQGLKAAEWKQAFGFLHSL